MLRMTVMAGTVTSLHLVMSLQLIEFDTECSSTVSRHNKSKDRQWLKLECFAAGLAERFALYLLL